MRKLDVGVLDQSLVPRRAEGLFLAHMRRTHLDVLASLSLARKLICVLDRAVRELVDYTTRVVCSGLETDVRRPDPIASASCVDEGSAHVAVVIRSMPCVGIPAGVGHPFAVLRLSQLKRLISHGLAVVVRN